MSDIEELGIDVCILYDNTDFGIAELISSDLEHRKIRTILFSNNNKERRLSKSQTEKLIKSSRENILLISEPFLYSQYENVVITLKSKSKSRLICTGTYQFFFIDFSEMEKVFFLEMPF